mmetsp:Transcript_17992/g.23452  ORF Transcript_17992/g.23452 Transcript_17992/m.23452 type:complete len:198 (+) Transcript_17992:195-788(+)|eukprot:CAMPEP_0197293916 /NCGR_PEP_ID=MMETSP0890-20130614/30391_1 /TAXON_ID=44058 ORGANISM="Aureoumbra lagunensis, Strain CCMP1510" /NCGR_SAMPLE_ID=MMETSP0890 /ASSEMBLY_ACC=CAM_ASM_000533 /LENGTH=197 /DNA_ID=CAMNT_0042769001 /DNA_START=127 /DNA_END=720 /DNA_ORIENTATION=+
MEEAKLAALHNTLKLLAPKGKIGGLGFYCARNGSNRMRTAADSMPEEKRMLYSRFVREGEGPGRHKTFMISEDDLDQKDEEKKDVTNTTLTLKTKSKISAIDQAFQESSKKKATSIDAAFKASQIKTKYRAEKSSVIGVKRKKQIKPGARKEKRTRAFMEEDNDVYTPNDERGLPSTAASPTTKKKKDKRKKKKKRV